MDDAIELPDGPLLEQPPANGRPKKQSMVFLDGLRGLAALWVYVSHNISWYYDPTDVIQDGYGWRNNGYYLITLPFIRVFFTGGSAAVAIFFVLSGFVLSRSTLSMLKDKHSYSNRNIYDNLLSAVIRRPIRLYGPPAAVSFLVAVSFQTPLRPLLNWPPAQSNPVSELVNFVKETVYGFNPFVEHAPFTSWYPYNPPIWTMPTEFNGSFLVFGLLAVSVHFSRRQRMILIIILGVVLLYSGVWAMSCFMAGMVLDMIELDDLDKPFLTRLPAPTRNLLLHCLFFGGWYLLSEVANVHEPERSYETFGWYYLTMMIPKVYYNKEYWRFWHSIGATMLIYAILRIRWLQSRLTSLKWLGKVSFCFYLIHTPLLWIVADRMYRIIGKRRPEQDMDSVLDNQTTLPDFGVRGLTTGFLICQSVLLPLTLILAQHATNYIDEPSLALSKRVSKAIMARLGRRD